MRRLLYFVAILTASLSLSAQKAQNCTHETDRLNARIDHLFEQNLKLKDELIAAKAQLTALRPPQIKDDSAGKVTKLPYDAVRVVGQSMVKVEGGDFIMGCANERDPACYYWEKPAHGVEVNTFYISKYLVTQRVWEAVMDTNPCFEVCADCPVTNVSWEEVDVFIKQLNNLSGRTYRLPTEAEWEYAAKGGNRSRGYTYAGSNNIDLVAWYSGNSDGKTHPVGTKAPNELGLFDMTGNAWQWCSDWFGEKYYERKFFVNPKGPDSASSGDYKVCRGGSWYYDAGDCRIINRDRYPIRASDDDVGFRLVVDSED